MARFLTYTFPAGNTTDVCQQQVLGGAGNLVLNGNLANPLTGNVSFISQGDSRQGSSTATAIVANCIITGTQNGIAISETISTANGVVYSVQVYDTITSVYIAGAVTVSVGTGWQGFFPLIKINLERDFINYSLTLATNGTNNSIAVFGTIENIVNNGSTYLNSVTNDYNIFTIKALTALNQYAYSNYPGTTAAANPTYSSLIIQLGTAAAAAITVPIKLNFIQI